MSENPARLVVDVILPILKKCNGFSDMIPLDVEAEPNKFYAISLWREKADAERYEKENFPKVKAEPFLTMPIVVRLCRVDETIVKKVIAAA